MDLTLRQLQKALHRSKQEPDALWLDCNPVIAELGNALLGEDVLQNSALRNGHVINRCTCRACERRGTRPVDPTRFVDSWVRKYGPDASVLGVLRGQHQQDDSGADAQSQRGQPQGGQAQEAQYASEAASDWRDFENMRQQDAAEQAQRKQQATQSLAQKAAESKAAALKALKDAKKMRRGSARRDIEVHAKRLLKSARRAASHNESAMASAPSLEARKKLAGACGRLRRVPPALRARVAEIINRLVAERGVVGDKVSPVPVYDSRKLVKRMLVKRPLPNALKEDAVSGRPVTLFLPDISPSCEAQAQDACDMANAAGYAGVSGSDVLVLPHSNGCIEGEAAQYIPWFNGKPVSVRGEALEKLFYSITAGRSSYRIRAVVAIGDHDAMELYEQIAAFKSVLRLVWLHNGGKGGAKLSGQDQLPGWSREGLRKLKLVYGCTNQRQMLRGLDLAIW